MILAGEPYNGASGVAGEIGHVALTAGRRQCYCGRHGCLETVASSEALAGLLSELHGAPITVPRMLELIHRRDRQARRLLAMSGAYIGDALAPAIRLINPAACIIGGDLSLTGETLLGPLREQLARRATRSTAAPPRVLPSQHGSQAEAYGAAISRLRGAPALLAHGSRRAGR